MRDYNVEYRAVFSDSWRGWLTNTTDTQAQFTGDPGQAYYFRVRGIDDVGNAGAWTVSSLVSIKSVTKYYHHGGARVAMRKDGEVYYLHGDHLGSTSLTTDSDGNVVSEARYHPFGTPRWQDGVAVTDFTFTGQRIEASFGLMDYNARYYSAVLGRFVSADTIVPDFANPQSLNRYSYVLNRPLQGGDPTGHNGPINEFLDNLYNRIRTRNEVISDKAFRRPEGGIDPSNWVDSDWAGRMILDRYLYGGGDWEIENDSDWTSYMQNNNPLTLDMRQHALKTAQDLYLSGQQNHAIQDAFSQEIENGEAMVGYQYLHGTNANAGGLQVGGSANLVPQGSEYLVELDLSYTWNDTIDPNFKYTTDIFKSRIAKFISLGRAGPYDIHITWNEKTTVYNYPRKLDHELRWI